MSNQPTTTEAVLEREFDHFSIVPFKAICGADRTGQTTTQDPRRAKCVICWQYWKEWDSSHDFAARLPAPSVAPEVDDSGFINRTEFLTALGAKIEICIANANNTSKPAAYRLMMEHFAEAGRQIIEFVEALPRNTVDDRKLSEAVERVLRNWPHSRSSMVRELLKVFAESPAPASTVAPVEQSEDPQCEICGTVLVLTIDQRTTWQQYACPESGKGNKLGHTIIPVGYKQSPTPTSPAALRDEAIPSSLPNAPDVDPNRRCWASTTNEACVSPRDCDDRGCQRYADEDYRSKYNQPTSRDIRAELIAAHSAMPRRWCSVHNREEFKYESLEHELRSARPRHIGSSRHPHFTHADHERMKETLDSLSDYPTEEEAEAVLQACGTSGKEVVNEFIEQLLKENSELKTKLESATTPPSTLVKAAETATREIMDHFLTVEIDELPDSRTIRAIIERCISGGGESDQELLNMLSRIRAYYSEEIFMPWTIEEARMVHEAFPRAVDRIAADSARRLIDRIVADIRAGEHRLPASKED